MSTTQTMQSVIITSRNKLKSEEYALKICTDQKISQFDTTFIRFQKEEGSSKNSIGIEDIRVIQQKLSLRPIQSKKKALIICDSHLLTTEAQNALLKTLEEPPADTIIILTVNQMDNLLPTISSRCTSIQLDDETLFTAEELNDITKTLQELPSYKLSKKLQLSQTIGKNKEDALVWLEKAIHAARNNLIENAKTDTNIDNMLFFIKNLQKTHTLLLTTNVNTRLLLENLLVLNSL